MITITKNWLLKQAEAAKFAWTIILVIFSLFGYSVIKEPNATKGTVQETVNARLELVEQQLKADPNTNKELSAEVIELKNKLELLELLIPNISVNNSVITKGSTTGSVLLTIPNKEGGYRLTQPVVK